jgi:translation initiation factor IF-2
MKRGYLLPDGCKDLIDVLKRKPHPISATSCQPQHKKFKPTHPLLKHPVPPVVGELVIPAPASVSELAKLLGQKPFKIIADVMELGFFVSAKQSLSFEIVSSVARKYGFIAKRGI